MQSIRRDLAIGLGLSGLAFVCALAWGSPFVAAASKLMPGAAQAQQPTAPAQQQTQTQPQSQVFTGTIVKNGGHYCLRDSSGQIYKLDDTESAKAYDGKSVKVTGQLDQQAMLIHVQNIQSAQT